MCAYTGKQNSVHLLWNENSSLRPDGQRPESEVEIVLSNNSDNEKYRVNEEKINNMNPLAQFSARYAASITPSRLSG
jgi:hypothetical protein